MNKLYVGLVHYPVVNKFGDVVTTSITNLDIHDIARSCMTFGVEKLFIINRLESQKKLFERIKKFWDSDIARKYNKDRVKAFSVLDYEFNIDDAVKKIITQEGVDPVIVTTTAARIEGQISMKQLNDLTENKPILLLFGTANGLTEDTHNNADYILLPIDGAHEYNHLSVRSAAAIVLDRISSEK